MRAKDAPITYFLLYLLMDTYLFTYFLLFTYLYARSSLETDSGYFTNIKIIILVFIRSLYDRF